MTTVASAAPAINPRMIKSSATTVRTSTLFLEIHSCGLDLASRLLRCRDRRCQAAPRKFKLGPLGSLNQVTKGLAKTIRAMADGTLDSQVGARICNGLGIMRACLETQKLEQLESRMDEIADRVARYKTNAARERADTDDEAQRLSN